MTRRAGEEVGGLLEAIRSAIVDGTLAPSQRLVEMDLARQFNASRGAVREVLLTLESEGLTERQPNRGSSVRTVSIAEAIEITEIRAALEGLCAAKAAMAVGSAEKRQLREVAKHMKDAVRGGDIVAYNRFSQESHLLVREFAKQRNASEILSRLRYQSVRYQFSITLLPGRMEQGLGEHLAVIDAVLSGSPDLAEQTMKTHLLSVIDALKRLAEWGESPGMSLGAIRPSHLLTSGALSK